MGHIYWCKVWEGILMLDGVQISVWDVKKGRVGGGRKIFLLFIASFLCVGEIRKIFYEVAFVWEKMTQIEGGGHLHRSGNRVSNKMHFLQRGINFQHEQTINLYPLMCSNSSVLAQQMVCWVQGKWCSLRSLSQEINSGMFCFPEENVTDGAPWAPKIRPGYTL